MPTAGYPQQAGNINYATATSSGTTGYISIDPGSFSGAQFAYKMVDNIKEKPMTTKFYRVKQNVPSLDAGAIIKFDGDRYTPVNDLYNTEAGDLIVEKNGRITFNSIAVEKSPEFFERVYEVKLLSKIVYKLKAEARELFQKEHTA